MRRLFAVYVVSIFLVGCTGDKTRTIQIHEPRMNSGSIKQLVLFFDGTQNDRDSRTNVSVLSEIVKHQDKDNLHIFYSEGVGTDWRIIGAMTGWGIEKDVSEAYAFLAGHYSPGSRLYIFGFSRGAYASRILAGMIYSVGIYDLRQFTESDRNAISRILYTAYKGKKEKLADNEANEILTRWMNQSDDTISLSKPIKYDGIEIEILGLWDTVEALGVKPTLEGFLRAVFGVDDPQNIVNPNGRYIDQICNVRNVYQALSLDDNRANVFTPIIISSGHVAKCEQAEQSSLRKVDEIWFSGAHSDVGGGYDKNGNSSSDYSDRDVSISGVSLNWMMSNIKKVAPELLPKYAKVYENPLGYVHEARNGSLLYSSADRRKILAKYMRESRYGKIRVHSSVIERLAETGEKKKLMGFDSGWYKEDMFKNCFASVGNGSYIFKECDAIEVVDNAQ